MECFNKTREKTAGVLLTMIYLYVKLGVDSHFDGPYHEHALRSLGVYYDGEILDNIEDWRAKFFSFVVDIERYCRNTINSESLADENIEPVEMIQFFTCIFIMRCS